MYLKYYEAGFVPLPIRPNSKAPAVKGFDAWAHEGIPRGKVEEFEEKFPIEKGYGIAILCGRASNICVLDVDSDDYSILSSCPPSPVVRRGKTGEARFFQFNPELTNRAFKRKRKDGTKQDGCDVLIEKKYIIIPPSIHPDTKKPYVWLSPENLQDIPSGELPVLEVEDVDGVAKLFGLDGLDTIASGVDLDGTYTSPDGKRSPHGSYNRVKALACGLVNESTPIELAIGKLLRYDREHHKPFGYFDDRRRHTDFGADSFSNAARFYCNILKTVNQGRMMKGLRPSVPCSEEISINVEEIRPRLAVDKKFIPYPEPRGMMKMFVDHCEIMGKGRQDALGLGGALIMMAGISSNRYHSTVRGLTVSPNLFVLNLGYSSFGKDVSQRLLDDLLCNSGMVGSANYRSGSAMVQNLPEQQERVDLIDECSWLLRAMSSGDHYQTEMVEILSLLFSRASSRFNGIASADKGARHGAVWNPHVSLLASTTPTGFRESVNFAMASKGLMPRFVTFFQKEIGEYKGEADMDAAASIFAELKAGLEFHMNFEKKVHPSFHPPTNYMAQRQTKDNKDVSSGIHYIGTAVPFEPNAHRAWMDYEKAHHYKSAKNPESFDSPFHGRFAELVAKLALLDSVSLCRNSIALDSFEWARALVEVCWKNVRPLYELATAQNKIEGDHLKVISIIEANNGLIPKTDLSAQTRWLTKRQRDDILASLIEDGNIKLVQITDPKKTNQKRPTQYYTLTNTLDNMRNKNHASTQSYQEVSD